MKKIFKLKIYIDTDGDWRFLYDSRWINDNTTLILYFRNRENAQETLIKELDKVISGFHTSIDYVYEIEKSLKDSIAITKEILSTHPQKDFMFKKDAGNYNWEWSVSELKKENIKFEDSNDLETVYMVFDEIY